MNGKKNSSLTLQENFVNSKISKALWLKKTHSLQIKKKEEVIPDVNEDTWPTEIEDQLTAKKKQEKKEKISKEKNTDENYNIYIYYIYMQTTFGCE